MGYLHASCGLLGNIFDFQLAHQLSCELDSVHLTPCHFQLRKLNKLASDNGFKYIRCKGDHGIFKNNNGLVVIPQGRSIGKGLSFKIQKAIYSLSSESA